MNKINKKGISAIVATVLIILITVAAVTIVWVTIVPMITNQLEAGTVCMDVETGLELLDKGYTCYNVSDDSVLFQIKHGDAEFELIDVQVLIFEGGSSTSFSLLDEAYTTADFPNTNEEKVFVIDTSGNLTSPDQIEIAATIMVGSTERTCGTSSSISLGDCN